LLGVVHQYQQCLLAFQDTWVPGCCGIWWAYCFWVAPRR